MILEQEAGMRLDNSNAYVREVLGLDPNATPGEVGPVDLCRPCAYYLMEGKAQAEAIETDHPPYLDGTYFCQNCRVWLIDEDVTIG